MIDKLTRGFLFLTLSLLALALFAAQPESAAATTSSTAAADALSSGQLMVCIVIGAVLGLIGRRLR